MAENRGDLETIYQQPQPITRKTKEQEPGKREYSPLEPLRRDFNSRRIYSNEEGKAIINDPDLHTIMQSYRNSVIEGSLLDLGAGTTHLHYMTAIEDKLSQITALDLTPKNIQLLHELLKGVSGKTAQKPEYVESQDVEILKLTAQAIAQDPRYGQNRTAEGILSNITQKPLKEDGQPDFIVGDMYDLTVLGDRKFDNILLGFSLSVSKDINDLGRLFAGIQQHLNPGGRIIIADFEGFSDEDLETFTEDEVVTSRYHTNYPLNAEILASILKNAGFSEVEVNKRAVETEEEEKEHDLGYLFAKATFKPQ